MTNHRTFRARPLRALASLAAALAIVVASLAAAPSPASAASYPPHCNGHYTKFNACLGLEDLGSFSWNANVGIDLYMNEWYARQLIACGARFQAELWGDDGGSWWDSDDFITSLPLKPGWPAAGPWGLAAEFQKTVHSYQLNEDSGQDELYAKISYYDCHAGENRGPYRTGTIRGYF